MKNKDWGRGRRGLIERGGLINFPPLKRGGGLIREGGLNRGFTIFYLFMISRLATFKKGN